VKKQSQQSEVEVQMPEIIPMKPLPPVKPIEKLPVTFHLTLIKAPEKGTRWFAVVLTEQQGDQIKRRKVCDTIEGRDLALDEFTRVAHRVFYFNEGETFMEGV
jgi:hypothetical protein